MNFKLFLKDKAIQIGLIIFAIVTIEIFLLAFPVGRFIRLYTMLAIFIAYFIGITIEYYNKKQFYNNIKITLDELDEKYFITEIIKPTNFTEGNLLLEYLSEINKSMADNVSKYKYLTQDYKEYVELWIHEIKIPIASSKMIVENNKDEITKSIDEELDKIEGYIEQALFYARSNTVEKDYYIKNINLNEIINESIKKNKGSLIREKVILNIHDLDYEVSTDHKWIVFILNQIIQNSIKYKDLNRTLSLEFYSKRNKENIVLYIKDNGVGIKSTDISRVFEKGFTGYNGRIQNKKSTGIGLYLCRKLCNKLGISIDVESTFKQGTIVKLIFPINSYTNIK